MKKQLMTLFTEIRYHSNMCVVNMEYIFFLFFALPVVLFRILYALHLQNKDS